MITLLTTSLTTSTRAPIGQSALPLDTFVTSHPAVPAGHLDPPKLSMTADASLRETPLSFPRMTPLLAAGSSSAPQWAAMVDSLVWLGVGSRLMVS